MNRQGVPNTISHFPGWYANKAFKISSWVRINGVIYVECEKPFEWGEGRTVKEAVDSLKENLSGHLELLLENKDTLAKCAQETLAQFMDVHQCERCSKEFSNVSDMIVELRKIEEVK